MNNYKSPERALAAAARASSMLTRGFVAIDVAARLVSMARDTIYGWAEDGSVAKDKIGKFVYVSLADLAKKAPGAFAGTTPDKAARKALADAITTRAQPPKQRRKTV